MRYRFDIPKFLDWVVESWAPVAMLADRACYTRSHFSRQLARELGEPPAALRRRLRLEAAAFLLRRSDWAVGEIAVEVGYQTPEALSKAFSGAFGMSPRSYRRSDCSPLLESKSGIHFHPSGIIVRRQGDQLMTLTQTLLGHHVEETRTILEAMAGLAEAQLDADTIFQGDEIPFDPHKRTLRALLDRIVFTQEVWLAAFEGTTITETSSRPTVLELQERHEISGTGLLKFAEEIETKGLWASEFVDALCDPPERFTFGGVIAHIVVFSAHRRLMALAALRGLGVEGLDYGDPINWQRGTVVSGCSS